MYQLHSGHEQLGRMARPILKTGTDCGQICSGLARSRVGAPIKSSGCEALSAKCLSHTLICRSATGGAAWSSGVTDTGQERAEDGSKKGALGSVCVCASVTGDFEEDGKGVSRSHRVTRRTTVKLPGPLVSRIQVWK